MRASDLSDNSTQRQRRQLVAPGSDPAVTSLFHPAKVANTSPFSRSGRHVSSPRHAPSDGAPARPRNAREPAQRRERNAARTSSLKSCGSSHAAKWPPRAASW